MTAQILAAELSNLIQDAKRKNTELRTAAEKTLQDLKSLPNTSEAQLSADISRRPHFISPFLIACNTHNAKFASTGVACLQRLSVSRSLPRERLTEVLEALKESAASSHDVQVKILQALPSLLQNYPGEIRGELLSTILQICSTLQNTKNFAVSNTAAATLQQLVITVYDRVAHEDDRTLEIPTVTEVKGDDGHVSVRPAANDAYKMFNDLVLLVMGEKPIYMRFSPIPPASILELIEAILSNHNQIMTSHPEQIYLLRTLLMPLIVRSLSDRLSFSVTVRIVRLLHLIIRYHLGIFPSECEIALGLLNHMLDPEASQTWKRALCLEVFRSIYADSRLLLAIYTLFDAQSGKKKIFGDNLAAFVRLAVEKPALIGLGQQSTAPTDFPDGQVTADQAVAEAGALAGVIGGPVNDASNSSRYSGLSTQWSSLKTPCIEHLDKSDPPSLPDTYLYSLVLTCITNISESLAKFVLPLTVHQEGRNRKKNKSSDAVDHDDDEDAPTETMPRRLSRTQSFRRKTIPVNPLDLTDHPAFDYVQTTSILVTECWPAIMATCSTFLNAALDTDYYRALIRAIQKFTQVAGLLRLSTPRDAFLTTMGKAAVPSNLLLANVSSPKTVTTEKSSIFSNAKGLLSVDSLVSQASSLSGEKHQRPSQDVTGPILASRNLLCLRALLNLAIALGPTLQSAWSIIFETLQAADLVMAMSSQNSGRYSNRTDSDGMVEKADSETSAVQAAARRLFESTVDYPNESFTEVLQALCSLLPASDALDNGHKNQSTVGRPQILHQRKLGSVSGISLSTDSNFRDLAFALNKVGELAALNEGRLAHYEPAESGWDIFVTVSVNVSSNDRYAASTRLLAADMLCQTVKNIAELSMAEEHRESVQSRILAALQRQIASLYINVPSNHTNISDTDMRIHHIALEALKGVIEQCGESMVAGWGSVIDSLMSVFITQHMRENRAFILSTYQVTEPKTSFKVISRSLARSAFATANLICSDFLDALPDTCIATLVELLLRFGCQQDDLNTSLTAITFFWKVSDFLQSRNNFATLSTMLDDIRRENSIHSVVQTLSSEGQVPALWLQVLLDLSSITRDERAEVRNSSIQTIQRIFENISEQLTADGWLLCLRVILFHMINVNLTAQREARVHVQDLADLEELNETTKTVLTVTSVLIIAYLEKLSADQFSDAWSELLDLLQQYFECGSHALGASVFYTMTAVLSQLTERQNWHQSALLKTESVWINYFKSRDVWSKSQESNLDAFVAYAEAFRALYQIADDSISERLPPMLENLESCIMYSDMELYSSDLDNMTVLQHRVLDCLALVDTERSGLPSHTILMMSRLILLPYTPQTQQSEKRTPTFVALSKASMALLQETVTKHINKEEIYSSAAFLGAVKSLAKPIQEKYIWQQEGKAPSLWQKATTTLLSILEVALPHVSTDKEVWAVVVDIAYFITRCQVVVPPASLEGDEVFDMKCFRQLRGLITGCLGSPLLPDTLRRTYARNLFSVSISHTLLPGELPDITRAPLEDLYRIRFGQTAELEPCLRFKTSQACLEDLFDLVSASDGSAERIKLAQAAAPYMILRSALPLRTYIADQPLRGRMPTPDSQKRELLLVLRKLAELETEPEAIPDTAGVRSKYRKHLHRLYPLLLRALSVARQDREVFEHLMRLTGMVGDEFGLEDD